MKPQLNDVILRGVLCRCPQCGNANLYNGVLKVRQRCPSCDMDFTREDSGGGDGTSVFLIFFVSLIAAIIMLVMVFALDIAIWISLAVMVVLVVVLTVVLQRPAKSLLIGLAWFHNAGDSSAKH